MGVRFLVSGRLAHIRELKHELIGNIVDFCEDHGELCIVSERSGGGDLSQWMEQLQQEGLWVQEETCAAYIRQVLTAMAFAHSQQVYHNNLTPACLLLTSRQANASLQVCDVGLASALDPDLTMLQRDPGPYIAPEIRAGSKRYTPGAPDLWSVGAIAHMMLLGHPPEEGVMSLGGGLFRARGADGWAERSSAARNFVAWLLQPSGDRPTAACALQHPWLKRAPPIPSTGTSAEAIHKDIANKTMCYELALLMLPALLPYKDLHDLRTAFSQADEDRDRFCSLPQAQRCLQADGTRSELVATALAVVDVMNTGVFDCCALACAKLIVAELGLTDAKGSASAETLAPNLMRRLLDTYGPLSPKELKAKLRSATGRDLEARCGVRFDDMLRELPEGRPIDGQSLATALATSCGRGTSLAAVNEEDDDDEDDGDHDMLDWAHAFKNLGLDKLVSDIFTTCGVGDKGRFRNKHGMLPEPCT